MADSSQQAGQGDVPKQADVIPMPVLTEAEHAAIAASVHPKDAHLRLTPDRLQAIRSLGIIHANEAEGAQFFQVRQQTFRAWLRNENVKLVWDGGFAHGKVSLRRLQYRSAQGVSASAVRMQIHLGFAWLGQKQKVDVDMQGGSPGQFIDAELLKDLSKDELDLLLRIHERLRARAAAGSGAAGGEGPAPE